MIGKTPLYERSIDKETWYHEFLYEDFFSGKSHYPWEEFELLVSRPKSHGVNFNSALASAKLTNG